MVCIACDVKDFFGTLWVTKLHAVAASVSPEHGFVYAIQIFAVILASAIDVSCHTSADQGAGNASSILLLSDESVWLCRGQICDL